VLHVGGRTTVAHREDVSLTNRFAATVAEEAQVDGGEDGSLLPAQLSRTAARLLEVDGAGFSVLVAGGRSPLGASSVEAELAERLQFTTGAGPCLLAHASGQPVFVVEEDLRRRWPVFADQLVTRTPFRGVVSLPLRWATAGVGAMDLFFRDPGDVARLDVFDALAVGDLVVSALGDAALWSTWSEAEGPEWLHGPPAVRRAAVWTAVSHICTALDIDSAHALELLRAHATATDRSADDVAADLLSGRLRPADLAAAGRGR
jgi:hypothetical protein